MSGATSSFGLTESVVVAAIALGGYAMPSREPTRASVEFGGLTREATSSQPISVRESAMHLAKYERAAFVRSLRGKYRSAVTGSEEFVRRKAEEPE